MYIDNENFDKWMERLSKKLGEIGQNLQSGLSFPAESIFPNLAALSGKW